MLEYTVGRIRHRHRVLGARGIEDAFSTTVVFKVGINTCLCGINTCLCGINLFLEQDAWDIVMQPSLCGSGRRRR